MQPHPDSGQGRNLAIDQCWTARILAPTVACARFMEKDMKRTSRLLARLVTTAAAVTIPLALATPPAPADPMHQDPWDSVAQCESSGNWSTNTGNGYYGGLQFNPRTWQSYGGQAYADTADHATRSQQIAIAEKVLQAQGWNAWPTCSKRVGLR